MSAAEDRIALLCARRMVAHAFPEHRRAQRMLEARYPLESKSDRDRAEVTEALHELSFWINDALTILEQRRPAR